MASSIETTRWSKCIPESIELRNKRSPTDVLTNFFHNVIPIFFQKKFTEFGLTKLLVNCFAMVSGSILLFFKPFLLWKYYIIWSKIKIIKYEKSNGTCFLEVFESFNSSPAQLETKSIKVLVFVHGGGWGSGAPYLYRLFIENTAKIFNAKAILVGYPTYPALNINNQSDMVISALTFIQENLEDEFIKTFPQNARVLNGIKPECQYILMGHSSGANICALALNKLASYGADIISPKVDYFIGLSGVYDIAKHYFWEKDRGVHTISPMHLAAVKFDNFANCSPTSYLRKSYTFGDGDGDGAVFTVDKNLYPTVFLLHGSHDTTVPPQSSREYAEALMLHDIKVHTAYPEYSHLNPISELSTGTDLATSRTATSDVFQYFANLIAD